MAGAAATGNPAVAFAAIGAQVGTRVYGQKRAEGWSPPAALAYGTAVGAVETLSEVVGAKVGVKLGLETAEQAAASMGRAAAKGATKSVFHWIDSPLMRKVAEGMGGATIEGGEELLANAMQFFPDAAAGIIQPIPLGDVDWKAVAKEQAETFAIGFVAGGVMNGMNSLVEWVQNPSDFALRSKAGIPEELFPTEADQVAAAHVARDMAEAALPGSTQGADPPPIQPAAEPTADDVAQAKEVAWKIAERYGASREQFDAQVAKGGPKTDADWQGVVEPFRAEAAAKVAAAQELRAKKEAEAAAEAAAQPPVLPTPPLETPPVAPPSSAEPSVVGTPPANSVPPVEPGPAVDVPEATAPAQDADSQRIQQLFESAAPKSGASVAKVEDGYRVTFGNGSAVDFREVEQVPFDEKSMVKALADYSLEDTPENRQWLQGSVTGVFNLRLKDNSTVNTAGLIRLKAGLDADAPTVLRHELIHFARQTGILADEQWQALVAKHAKGVKDEGKQQEAIAYALQDEPGLLNKIGKAIAALLESLGLKPGDVAKLEEALRSGELFAGKGTAPQVKSIDQLATNFRDEFLSGKSFKTIVEARALGEKLTGSTIKPGTPAAKAFDEAVEVGVVQAAKQIIRDNESAGDAATFDALVDLYERQPNLNVRTATSKREQAFSTPAPLAFVAQRLAGVRRNTRVYDSSAGNGMLLTASDKPLANELNTRRAEALKSQGIQTTNQDATRFRPESQELQEAIVINPPFGTMQTPDGKEMSWTADGIRTQQVDHAIALNTLQDLAPDGKAVVIIGAKGFQAGDPKPDLQRASAYSRQKRFYDRIYSQYNVVDHFTVSGDLYSRQGAKFPVDVIVIDGKGGNSRPRPWNFKQGGLPELIQSWGELRDAKLAAGSGVRASGSPEAGSASSAGGPTDGLETVRGPAGDAADVDAKSAGGRQDGAAGSGGGVEPTKPAGGPDVEGSGGSGVSPTVGGRAGGQTGTESTSVPATSDANAKPGDGNAGSDRPGGVAGQSPELNAEDLLAQMESMFDELEGPAEKPAAEKPTSTRSALPRKNRSKSAAESKPKEPTKTQQKAAEARKQAMSDLNAFLDGFKNDATASMTINPDHVRRAATAAISFTKAGIYTFAEFVEIVGKQVPERMRELAPYLEAAWHVAQKRDTTGQVGPAGKVADVWEAPQVNNERPVEAETEFQVAYEPRSKSGAVGTLLPRNHASAVARALDAIEEKHGDIDEFVAKELGFSPKQTAKFFSAEQIDALAMAIANDKNNKLAFVLADQTGVGKGRVVAGMIRYAIRNGLTPIFVTEKPSLYADMMRDLTDIGMNEVGSEFNPLMTNNLGGENKIDLHNQLADRGERIVSQTGKIPERLTKEAIKNLVAGNGLQAKYGRKTNSYDAIFTTYSQLSPVKGEETWRHSALRELAPKSYLILDESHNAGGSGPQVGWDGEETDTPQLTRSEFVRELAGLVDNVMFSSATFAKRPEVMDLYARAGLSMAVDDPTDLPAMIEAGGVPLQQVVSEMMVEAGLMLRRERSFDGVEFSPVVVPVDLSHADSVSEIYRAIHLFSELRQSAIDEMAGDVVSAGGQIGDDQSTGNRGLDSQNFTSILWNLTDQMLLSLKAEEAANAAIAAHKRGESPVIVVDNTMESALIRFMEENELSAGDVAGFSYRNLLQHYLDRSREVLIKHDRDDPKSWERVRIPDSELSGPALEAWDAAVKLVGDFDLKMPASPIDWIRQKLMDAGLSVAEVTGREVMLDYSDSDGTHGVLVDRPQSEQGNQGKAATINAFNDGTLDVPILNRSGSTGLSIHASKEFKNQKRRHMIIAQAAKNIDEFMQMLGRVNRTGQTSAPIYSPLMTDVPAENRPAAVLLKKLASLNANVTASSKGSVSFDVPDIVNAVGDHVAFSWISENQQVNGQLAYPAPRNKKGDLEFRRGIAAKLSGRIVLLPVEQQQKFWDDILESYQQRIDELNAMNANPLTAQTLDMDAKTTEKFAITRGVEDSSSTFLQPAYLERLDAKVTQKSYTSEQVGQAVSDFYELGDVDAASLPGEVQRKQVEWVREQQRKLSEESLQYGEQRAEAKRKQQNESLKKFDEKNAGKEKYAEKRQEFLESQGESREQLVRQLGAQRDAILNAMRQFSPGTDVDVIYGDETLRGTVIGFGRNKGDNPIAPSKWHATIAVADAMRRRQVPVSQLATGLEVMPRTTTMQRLSDFDNASSVNRETRYVATGNLLTAYEQFGDINNKSIAFFTDSDGKLRRGLLMPSTFSPERWQADRPAVFQSSDDVLEFLEAGGQASSADGTLLILRAGGQLIIRAPKSGSRSGKYVTNPAVMDAAAPSEFIRLSQRWELTVPPTGNQTGVLDAIMKLVSIQTTSDRELARRVLGDRVDPLQPVDAKGNPTRQSRSTAARNPQRDQSKAAIASQDIIKTWERIFGVPIRVGGIGGSRKIAGIYKYLTEVVRVQERFIANLAVASHEIGHHIDNKVGFTDKDRLLPKMGDTAKMELAGLDYEPKGRVSEGFAEYVRRWITEQNAQAVAPVFTRYFERWLEENPAWKQKFNEARQQARDYADQSVFKRISSAIGHGPEDLSRYERWKQKMRTRMMRLSEAQVNKFVALDLIDKELDEANWQGMKPGEAALHYDMSANAHAAEALENGVHSIRTGHRLSNVSLWSAQQYLENDAEYDEAVAYAYAKHTLFMRKRNPDYNTGLDAADALAWVERMKKEGKSDRFDKFAGVIAEFGDTLLDMMVDAGALPVDLAENLKEYYAGNYFPLHRVREGEAGIFAGSGFMNLPAAVGRRSKEGSGRRIIDPFDAMVNRAMHDYSRAAKARVAATLVEALDPQLGGVQGFGGFLDRVPPKRKVNRGQIKEILATLVEQGVVHEDLARAMTIAADILEDADVSETRLRWFADRHGIDQADDKAMKQAARKEPDALATISLWRQDFTPNAAKRTVLHYDKVGNPILYEMDDMLYRVATGLNVDELGPVLATMRKGATIFKTGATAINTGFSLANMFRDYVNYQGRAKYVKGVAGPLVQPPIQLARYAWAKTRSRLTGKPLSEIDATTDFIEKTGGKIYTKLGDDAARRRLRHRRLGTNRRKGSFAIDLPAIKEFGEKAIDVMQEVTAWSDLPPRMAEAQAAIEASGYQKAGGKWRNVRTGKIVDYLPEFVQIKAGLAAANATINFKRGGTRAVAREALMPFTRSQVNALYRQSQLIANLRKLAQEGDAGDQARRFMFYYLALAGVTAGHVLSRYDDDDYQEMPDYDRRRYWSVGYGGKTIARLPKPQDDQIFINAVENLVGSFLWSDGTGVLEGMGQDAKDLLPSGGGFLVGLLETAFNKDTFRGREIEPAYMAEQGIPVEYREDSYTLEASKLISQHLGKYLGLSPMKVQHLLDSSSGGVYHRWADFWEATLSGDLDTHHIPFAGRFFPNRHQSRSISDFYDERQKAKEDRYRERLDGKETGPAARRVESMEDYAEIMAAIRKAEPTDNRGRRTYEFTPYLVGLSREALGRDPMESNPNPFESDVKLPEVIQAIVAMHASREAKTGVLSYGRPATGDDPQELEARRRQWEENRQQSTDWLLAHADHPLVAKEIEAAMRSQSFQDLLRMRGRPSNPAKAADWSERRQHAIEFANRYRAARKEAGLQSSPRTRSALPRRAS